MSPFLPSRNVPLGPDRPYHREAWKGVCRLSVAFGASGNVANGIQCELGTCVALLAVGTTCSLTSHCASSAYCDYATGVCTEKKAAGTACTGSTGECADGAYCDLTANQCAAQKANGAGCTTSGECSSGNCSSKFCQVSPPPSFPLPLQCG
jgi:hypothetical protein